MWGGLRAPASNTDLAVTASIPVSGFAGLVAAFGFSHLFTEKILDSSATGLAATGHHDKAYVCKALSLILTKKQCEQITFALFASGFIIGAIHGIIAYTTGCYD